MELIKILALDPSLRNTGMALVTYNNELPPTDPKAFVVSNCQVLVNPMKFTGVDAILNMMDMMSDECKKECYLSAETVIVESPPLMFNKAWAAGTISSIAHVSGAAVALFGIEKSRLFRPNEWNKCRKKEVTHTQTVGLLGNPDTWHFEKRIKSEKLMEHILDAASMAVWWIKSNYLED